MPKKPYFYHVAALSPGGITSASAGVIEIESGETRQDVYKLLQKMCVRDYGPGTTITSFYLEPNEL